MFKRFILRTGFSLTVILILFINSSLASEKAIVCAKYRTNYGWSDGYKVEATIISGTELNRATNSFSYNAIATYVVIFWDQDQASVIEMDFPYLSPIGQTGEDQQGRQWEVAKTNVCF